MDDRNITVVADGGAIEQEDLRELFRERARILSEVPAPEESGEKIAALSFELGGEIFGIELKHLAETRRATPLRRLPGARGFFGCAAFRLGFAHGLRRLAFALGLLGKFGRLARGKKLFIFFLLELSRFSRRSREAGIRDDLFHVEQAERQPVDQVLAPDENRPLGFERQGGRLAILDGEGHDVFDAIHGEGQLACLNGEDENGR